MAENRLETRILLRYATYEQWMNSRVILQLGETAIAAFPSNVENAPPQAIGIKVGDGRHYFYELPWIQAIAADVYDWAKSSTKPTYTAEEIQGLQNYIQTYAPGANPGGDVTVAAKLYQIVRGTGDNQNKYYLQSKDNTEDADWVIDTSHYIDLEDLAALKTWLNGYNNDLSEYINLHDKISSQIYFILDAVVNVDDTPVDNQFVTSVSQLGGRISVTRGQPSFDNLTGQATVPQGGTGVSSFPEQEVLVGNGSNAITTIPIATEIVNNNDLVPNYLIKQYVDSATNGIVGAMHFIGEALVEITNNSSTNPSIPGYNFLRAKPGDVVLYEEKEFVWNGNNWILLGDETSYAIKGSIKDSDIDAEADISQSKIYNLENDLSSKVDKEEGKQLSSEDYTKEEKEKLELIEPGAQVNVIEHIFVNEKEQLPYTINGNPNSVALSIKIFDDEYARKLDTIEEYAQVNKINHIFINGVEQQPTTINNRDGCIDLTLDSTTLNLTGIEGARYRSNNSYIQIEKDPDTGKLLELSKVAATGNIDDLEQSSDTYVILDCGSSTEVI